MATGGGRAGPEPSSRGATSRAPAPNPCPDSPACGAGLSPFGVIASSSPSPRSPNHWDPGLASGSSSSWVTGGAAMAGGPPAAATTAWRSRGAVAGRAGAPCCCPRRDSGLGEAAVSAPPPPLLQLRPRRRLALSAPRLLPLPPLPPGPAPPPPALLLLLPPPPPRCSPARYYAGENGLLGPGPPRSTLARGLLKAGPSWGMCQIHLSLPLVWGGIQGQDAQVAAAPGGSVTGEASRPPSHQVKPAVLGPEAKKGSWSPHGHSCVGDRCRLRMGRRAARGGVQMGVGGRW